MLSLSLQNRDFAADLETIEENLDTLYPDGLEGALDTDAVFEVFGELNNYGADISKDESWRRFRTPLAPGQPLLAKTFGCNTKYNSFLMLPSTSPPQPILDCYDGHLVLSEPDPAEARQARKQWLVGRMHENGHTWYDDSRDAMIKLEPNKPHIESPMLQVFELLGNQGLRAAEEFSKDILLPHLAQLCDPNPPAANVDVDSVSDADADAGAGAGAGVGADAGLEAARGELLEWMAYFADWKDHAMVQQLRKHQPVFDELSRIRSRWVRAYDLMTLGVCFAVCSFACPFCVYAVLCSVVLCNVVEIALHGDSSDSGSEPPCLSVSLSLCFVCALQYEGVLAKRRERNQLPQTMATHLLDDWYTCRLRNPFNRTGKKKYQKRTRQHVVSVR